MSNDKSTISRVTRSRAEAQSMYDRISRWYDLLEGIWEKKPKDIGLRRLGVKAGEIVLEIGFGTGHGILALAQSVGETGKVYGIDISQRMIDITQSRVNKAGISKRIELKCGDAIQLPFQAKYFDAIFMSFVLELFDTPEIPKVLYECQRVLQSNGRICVVSLSKVGGLNWMRELYELGHRQFPKFLDCRPIFVKKIIEDTGFQILNAIQMSLWGLGTEIIIAKAT
jgi:ubiquinone/menaquinone biosynthesis C-methylase UbiE